MVQFAAGMPAAGTSSRRSGILSCLRLLLAGALLAAFSTASLAADPLVLLLLRMLRDQVITSALEAGYEAALDRNQEQPAATPPAALRLGPSVPGSAGEEERLKALIDEGFIHLTPGQRAEVLASLMKILNDPANAAQRAALIAHFTQQVSALRDAHRILSQLSDADMRALVAGARSEFERLPREQQEQMLQVLRRGMPGVPHALNQMMLSEFSRPGG